MGKEIPPILLDQAKIVKPRKTELIWVNSCRSSRRLIITEQAIVTQQTTITKA